MTARCCFTAGPAAKPRTFWGPLDSIGLTCFHHHHLREDGWIYKRFAGWKQKNNFENGRAQLAKRSGIGCTYANDSSQREKTS